MIDIRVLQNVFSFVWRTVGCFVFATSNRLRSHPIHASIQCHPKASPVIDQQIIEHHTSSKHFQQIDLELECVFHLIIYIDLSFIIIGIDMLLAILSQLDVSATGITKLHIRSQGIVPYLLTIVPVNASLGADPHSTILSLNYRIHTGT